LAFALGSAFLACAFRFAQAQTLERARFLFYASIIYLPLLFALMVMDRRSQ
jgi:heme O synthase-like polyprenyltransferase